MTRGFKDWLLAEGRFDRETTQICRAIVNAVKTLVPRMYSDRGEICYHGDQQYLNGIANIPPKPLPGIDNNGINVLVVLIPSDRMSVSGSYRPARKLLRVNLNLQIQRIHLLANMPRMIEMLKDTIRHELEHTSQREADLDAANPTQTDIWQNVQSILGYYTHPTETAAFVAGIYKRAKTTKTSFTQKMREYLGFVAAKVNGMGLNPQDVIPTIEDQWLKYARQRFVIN